MGMYPWAIEIQTKFHVQAASTARCYRLYGDCLGKTKEALYNRFHWTKILRFICKTRIVVSRIKFQ